jgi:uncharacterized protein with FMN-binding domain
MKKKIVFPGILLILMLSLVFVGCSKEPAAPAWKDGAYSGKAEGVHGDIELSVEISGGKIAKINVVSEAETSGVSELAFEQVPSAIIEKQTAQVDTVAGATVSSKAIITAVEDALSKAK